MLSFVRAFVRRTSDWNLLPCPGTIVTTCVCYVKQEVLVRNAEQATTARKIWKRSKGKKRLQSICPTNLPESFSLESILSEWCVHHQEGPWIRVIGQKQLKKLPSYHETQDCEPHGRAVLLCFSNLQLSAWVPLPNKLSCFVRTRVSSDNTFLSIRKEPSLGPWKWVPFLATVILSVLSLNWLIFTVILWAMCCYILMCFVCSDKIKIHILR